MTLTVNRTSLIPALAAAARISRGKETRISAIKNVLVIESTDLEHWVSFTLPAKGKLESVQIDGQRLHDVMASLLDDEAGLSMKDGALKIQSGKGRRTMATITQEWPALEFQADVTVTFPIARLIEAFAFCSPHVAAAGDIAKSSVSGVHLYAEKGQAHAIGADGYQMALFDIGPCKEVFAATLSPKCVELVMKMAEGSEIVEIGINDRATEFRWTGGKMHGAVVRGPRIEGAFPRGYVDQAATIKHTSSFGIEAGELLAGLRSVRVLGEQDKLSNSTRIRLNLDKGGARLCAGSHMGDAEQEIVADYAGEDAVMGFSAVRMERILAGFGDAVLTVGIGDEKTPMRLDAIGLEDRFALLQGLRV